MLELLTVFAAEEASSQTPFYVVGGLAALYGVVIATIGIKRPDFPARKGQARAVFAISTVVVLAAMASAIATS